MTGWSVWRAWCVAWRPGELSQQPTWPQVRHSRRWTHDVPARRHSSHPAGVRGGTGWSPTSCSHSMFDLPHNPLPEAIKRPCPASLGADAAELHRPLGDVVHVVLHLLVDL